MPQSASQAGEPEAEAGEPAAEAGGAEAEAEAEAQVSEAGVVPGAGAEAGDGAEAEDGDSWMDNQSENQPQQWDDSTDPDYPETVCPVCGKPPGVNVRCAYIYMHADFALIREFVCVGLFRIRLVDRRRSFTLATAMEVCLKCACVSLCEYVLCQVQGSSSDTF